MSANVYWSPATPKEGTSFNAGAPSSFISTLEQLTGSEMPLVIDGTSEFIRGAVAALALAEKGPWKELQSALCKYGSVNIWAEY